MTGIVVTGDVAGGTIAGTATGFTVGGKPVALVGDKVSGHGEGPHAAPSLVEGSGWMTWNGLPVVVNGCMASCGHAATATQVWFVVPK